MKILLLLFILSSPLYASCAKNFLEYEGVCASLQTPVEGDSNAPTPKAWVSDEKPPRNPQPAYERNDVKIIDIKPQDAKSEIDDQVNWAGKKAITQ